MSVSLSRLLLIDDDPSMNALICGLVGQDQIHVEWVKTLEEGIVAANGHRIDLIILDHKLPDGDGIDKIDLLIAQDRLRPILYVTAQAGSDTAIEAIKRGAFDYLSKPIDFALLHRRILEAIEYRQLTRTPVVVSPESDNDNHRDVLVGRCRAMQEVYKGIGRLSALSVPVLIEGEVGTGKEMIAHAIHQHGRTTGQQFLKIIASDLDASPRIEALLDESSIDTHAPSQRLEWNRGTALIEEISNIPLGTQSQILKFLQDPRTGNQTPNVRLIFTSSTPTKRLVEQGKLRSDLYYFLSPYILRVPPLRERREDIDLLVAHFMQRLAHVSTTHQGQSPPRVSPTALQLFRSHDWPGNVAQLKSVLQSVLMESRGAVLATDTLNRVLESHRSHNELSATSMDGGYKQSGVWDLAGFVKEQIELSTNHLYEAGLRLFEHQLLQQVLQHTHGNQAAAARILGITRTSLRRKIIASRIQLSTFDDVTPDDPTSEHEAEPESFTR